jgi:GH15 family glucan-1,4-alpha-glucosidase
MSETLTHSLSACPTKFALKGEDLATSADFTVSEGGRVSFVLTYGPSHRQPPAAIDADPLLNDTEAFWREWSARCTYDGYRREAVMRSLLTLEALTFAETGGIVAAPTTCLPEQIGGPRNWDYRYCWVRDATLTLIALMGAGYYEEAKSWRDWLQRAVASTCGLARRPLVAVVNGLGSNLNKARGGRAARRHRRRRH